MKVSKKILGAAVAALTVCSLFSVAACIRIAQPGSTEAASTSGGKTDNAPSASGDSGAESLSAPAGKDLLDGSGDAAKLEAFTRTFKGDQVANEDGAFPGIWSANMWDGHSSGDVVLSEKPVYGSKAIALRNTEGGASIQYYNWQAIPVTKGKTYVAYAEYLTEGDGKGNMMIKGDNVTQKSKLIEATKGKWKAITIKFSPRDDGTAVLQFQNHSAGKGNPVYLRKILLVDPSEAGAEAPAAPAEKAAEPEKKAEPASSRRSVPDVKGANLADSRDPYYLSIDRALKAPPVAATVLANSAAKTLEGFEFASTVNNATSESVPSSGQPFGKALRIKTEKCPEEWNTHIHASNVATLRRGDVLYVTASTKVDKSASEWGQGIGRIYSKYTIGGKTKYVFVEDFPIETAWSRQHFAFKIPEDIGPGEMELMFTFGHQAQQVEIGGVAAVDLGPSADITQLPKRELKLEYAGRESNAPWRVAALARIEKIRKGELKVIVKDAAGHPAPDSVVEIKMTRQAFVFGSNVSVAMLPGTNVRPWGDFAPTAGAKADDKKRYQDTFKRYFNSAALNSTWATWAGLDKRITKNDILAGLKWLKENGIPAHDAQIVYPRFEFVPEDARRLNKDPARFSAAIHDHIKDIAPALAPFYRSFQVTNELAESKDFTDLLGEKAVFDWYRWTREAAPTTKVMLNENRLLSNAPNAEELRKSFEARVRAMQKDHVPLDYIGDQSHLAIDTLLPPEKLLKMLDRLAALGLPIEITEFDLPILDPKDSAQRQFQGDYTRDFMIAVFSHANVQGITLWDFWEPAAWRKNWAMFNADWSVNPNGKAYADLVLDQWTTHGGGKTDATGAFSTRGFYGTYEVKVSHGTGSRTVTFNFAKGAAPLQVTL